MTSSLDSDDAPLYVRWEPEGLGFAVEVRLDLIARLRHEVEAAQNTGVEIGGVFLGRPPQPSSALLRVDDFVAIPRRPEDGSIFMLDPGEHDRFLTTRWDAKSRGRSAVGFFRTHVRPGPLRISLADRTLLTGHFTREAMLVLLIQAHPPFQAALFTGVATRLPSEPSVPEFLVDERAFQSLPELDGRGSRPPRRRRAVPSFVFWALCLVLLLGVAGLTYRTWDALAATVPGGQGGGPVLRASGTDIVTITWNQFSSEIRNATGGTLTILDGVTRRDVPLGADALQLGVVEYQPQSTHLNVTLTLSMPNSTALVQSASWPPGS